MGFRSTYISEDWNVDWPDWFREKHDKWINEHNLIASPGEIKWADEIMQDIHKALLEIKWFDDGVEQFTVVALHECGGVSKIDFSKDAVYAGHPTDWEADKQDDWIDSQHGHSYCYGCSDLDKYTAVSDLVSNNSEANTDVTNPPNQEPNKGEL